MVEQRNQREQHLNQLAALKSERASWDPHWRDLADYFLPRRARFDRQDRNQGSKRNDKIINSTPTRSARVLAAGLMSSTTSPARPWFRLTTPDPALAEFGAVRAWLHVVEERMRDVMARSNLYNAFATLYGDLPVFGTSPMWVDEDPDKVIRAYVLPVGSYCLANNARGQVDTVYREPSMTVGQVVQRFGLERVSAGVRDSYRRGDYQRWVDLVHLVEPNRELDSSRKDQRGMPFRSVWFEANGDASTGLLHEKGYHEFPVMVPRWLVTGEDVYGHGPGMDVLGDAKALQTLELKKAQAAALVVQPPMTGPAGLKNIHASLLPGDYTPSPADSAGQRFQPAMTVEPQAIAVLGGQIQDHEGRIEDAFYVRLFLMMAESDRAEITAREVDERREEKMLQLGPTYERLSCELYDPTIDRTFEAMVRRGMVPPAPRELQGRQLRVEYISVLSQAQRAASTVAIEKLAGYVGNVAALYPDARDKFNADESIDEVAAMLGTKPDLVLPDDQVARIRAARAQQQQQQAAMEKAAAAIQGAKTMADTAMDGDSALTRLLGTMGPAAAAAQGGGGGA